MDDQGNWMEFTRFVPGFDFLRNLAPGGPAKAAPSAFGQWLAPTMDPAEVQKRIDELKVVKFWLEQNGRALDATIQALEVQKMTLSTLGTMNRGAREMADVFQEGVKETAHASAQAFAAAGHQPEAATGAPAPRAADEAANEASSTGPAGQSGDAGEAAAKEVQHMQQQAVQWWSALTEQFQAIAQQALQDIGRNMTAAEQAAAAAPQPAPAAPVKAAAPARKRAAKSATRTASKSPAAKKAPAARAKSSSTGSAGRGARATKPDDKP